MASYYHLVCSEGNPARSDRAGSTDEDKSGGHESHRTNLIRYRNWSKKSQGTRRYPMDCQMTMSSPLRLRDVVREERSREQHTSSVIEQIFECSTHLVQRTSRVEVVEEKVEVRANVVLLPTDPCRANQCSKWRKSIFKRTARISYHTVIAVAPTMCLLASSSKGHWF